MSRCNIVLYVDEVFFDIDFLCLKIKLIIKIEENNIMVNGIKVELNKSNQSVNSPGLK